MSLTLEDFAFDLVDPVLDIAWSDAFRNVRYVPPPIPTGHFDVHAQMSMALRRNQRSSLTLWVTGQVGAGKSMLISRLIREADVTSRYTVMALPVEQELGRDINDVRVILIYVIQKVADLIVEKGLHSGTEFAGKHIGQVTPVLRHWLTLMAGAGGVPSAPHPLQQAATTLKAQFLEISYAIVRDPERRRQVFGDEHYSTSELNRLAHALILFAQDQLELRRGDGLPGSHRLLLVLDDLDKFYSPSAVASVFLEGFTVLDGLPCAVVLTFPYSLLFNSAFQSRIESARVHTVSNVKVQVRDIQGRALPLESRTLPPAAVVFFDQLLSALHPQAPSLLEPGELQRAAIRSAGVPRQFLALLFSAAQFAMQANKRTIDASALDFAFRARGRELQRTATRPDDQSRLKLVHKLHEIRGFSRLFQSLHVVEYVNDKNWYAVHPALERFVDDWVASDERLFSARGVPAEKLESSLVEEWRKDAGAAADDAGF